MELPKPKPSDDTREALAAEKRNVYNENKNRVIDHLRSKGLRDEAVAAILANIDVETGGSFDFTQKQTKSGDPSDPRTIEYGGYGLFQFDDYSPNQGHRSWYQEYLKDTGKEDSTESQIDYVIGMIYAKDPDSIEYKYKERMGKGDAEVLQQYLDTTDNPRQISDAFVDRFEKAGIPHSDKRRNRTDKYYREITRQQNINQDEPISDTGADVPMSEEKGSFPEERVIDVPEDKSTYQKVKPYIPVLRHLNEGGAIPMKRQMEMFDEGGLSTDEDFKEDLEGTFEITPEMQERIDEMTKEERDALRKKLVADAMERMLAKSPEKMDRSKFIQQYNEGGLEQDGGTVDPVSGNDVPPGSTQEEVRDDIPAQLSEGEFVFPADVVRFIGLNNLMQMRQEAKMGLKMMEEMGQMGNSDQATMPDDLPFDINDLDMDDEIDDNNELEMQEGGVVPGQGFVSIPPGIPTPRQQVYGISGFQQAAAPTTGVAPIPQAASQQFVQPTRPQQAPVPTYQPREIPEYVPFIGGGAPNVEQETRQFINDEGNIIDVIYNKATGEPLNEAEKAKITEGYKPYDPTAPKVEETTVTPTQVGTTSVIQDSSKDERQEQRQREEEARFGPGGGRLAVDGVVYGVSFDMPEGFIPGIGSGLSTAFGLAAGKPLPEDVTVNFKRDDTTFRLTGTEYNLLKDNLTNQTGQDLINKAIDRTDTQDRIRAVTDKYAEALSSDDKDTSQNAQRVVNEYIKQAAKKNIDKKTGQVINPFEMNRGKGTASSVVNPPQDFAMTPKRGDGGGTKGQGQSFPDSNKTSSSKSSDGPPGTSSGSSGSSGTQSGATGGGYGGGFEDRDRFRAKGGLMEAPKPKAKKKMKRGG